MHHICFVTSEFPSPLRGGVERVTFNLMAEFNMRNVVCCSVSRERPLGTDPLLEKSFSLPDHTNICSSMNIDFLTDLCRSKGVDILINNSHEDVMLELCSLLKEKLPEIKIISCLHGNPVGLLSSIKDELARIEFSSTGFAKIKKMLRFWTHYPYRCYSRRKWLRIKYGRLYEKSDAVVLLTPHTVSVFQDISGIHSSNKLYVIPNMVPETKKMDVPDRKPWILWVGRMTYDAKRPDRMIRVWEKICDKTSWQLKMIGDGPARKDLENYCHKHSIKNIEFSGRQNPESFYQQAQILCMTSSTEGSPMVLLEAMMHGVVPMAFNSFPAAEDIIVNGENGILVNDGSIKEYAEKLLYLMQTSDLRKKFSANAVRVSGHFADSVVMPQWLTLFRKLGK